MTCKECGYCWKEECEKYAHCHFEGPEGWAPCEQEEEYEEEEDEEDDEDEAE